MRKTISLILVILTVVTTVFSAVGTAAYAAQVDDFGYAETGADYPVITAVEPCAEGVVVNWSRADGIGYYRVYRLHETRGWVALGDTNKLYYIDSNVRDGNTYQYRVAGVRPEGSILPAASTATYAYPAPSNVTSVEATPEGILVRFNKPAAAAKVAVFRKNGSSWNRIAESTGTSYLDTETSPSGEYTYTVRALKADGNYLYSFYDETGVTVKNLATPQLAVQNAAGGVLVTWDAVQGAEGYRVFEKHDGGSWTRLEDTTGTSYLDTDAESGTTYTYTVRCISSDGGSYTSYYDPGKSVDYIAAPKLISASSTGSGIQISWEPSEGAEAYRVFYKNSDGGWTRLASKYLTEYTDTSVADGETRTYTIRCLNEDGDFVSGFNTEGWSNTYFAAPEVSSVSYDGSYTVEWQGREGVASYRLYRRTLGSSWSRLFDSTKETRYTDNDVQSDKIYAYTLRYMDADGNLISGYLDKVRYYKNGKPVSGNIYDNGTYGCEDGYPLIGLNRVDGYLRYYNSQGRMYRDTVVGNSSVGYYYTDPDGICIESEEMRLAAEFIEKYCKGETMKEKMKYAFLYMAENYPYERVYDDTPSSAADIPPFAIELFSLHKGTCYRYAAAYACVAKIAGYRTRFAYGMSGVLQHGWTEVYVDGSWLICDVDAQLPGYGYEDYAPYMMSTHMWVLDKYWYSELTLKNGKAVWTPIQYF